jgi:hypothetical protein
MCKIALANVIVAPRAISSQREGVLAGSVFRSTYLSVLELNFGVLSFLEGLIRLVVE